MTPEPTQREPMEPTRAGGAANRLLIVFPSWVGDAVMATPAAAMIRERLRGWFIGGLVRPGIDEVLEGAGLVDEMHVERAQGMMGPKRVAGTLRPRRYQAALLLTNSFSTALVTRLAGIPRRVGYARDGRSLLLTERLEAPRRADGRYAPVSAVAYYLRAARALLDGPRAEAGFEIPAGVRLRLTATAAQRQAGGEVLARAGAAPDEPLAILNPGGNNPAKRWPAERFAEIGRRLAAGVAGVGRMRVLVNGSPAEAEVVSAVVGGIGAGAASLAACGGTIGSLMGVLASGRARIMVTNDTGPRHLAAALGVPVVTLFGPTDHRWTTIPVERERIVLADPTLPESEVADDHPERCRVDRIEVETVWRAVGALLA
ncbi:MAG: glycosyltransferase family 9 protein [Phycisphaerae bacterium]|nr:glycosyltransferase family 9 protein [Phycisphaerae bacterium]